MPRLFPPLTTVIPKRRALPSPCPSSQAVNYDKLREVTQGPGENPALLLNRLTKAMMLHTRLYPASNAGATVLASHFISQSAPDIRRQLIKAEDGPKTPIRDLVNMAFKVFNNQEAEAEPALQARLQQKVALQPAANTCTGAKPKSRQKNAPPGACFKCTKEEHWARQCPQPQPLTKPCPDC